MFSIDFSITKCNMFISHKHKTKQNNAKSICNAEHFWPRFIQIPLYLWIAQFFFILWKIGLICATHFHESLKDSLHDHANGFYMKSPRRQQDTTFGWKECLLKFKAKRIESGSFYFTRIFFRIFSQKLVAIHWHWRLPLTNFLD